MDQRTRLVEAVFSDRNQIKVVKNLSADDSQVFVDVVYEVGLHTRSSSENQPTDT